MVKSKALCYFCGTPVGETKSREHVPPKMMFKQGTDSITVPSCKAHNQDKSGRDAVIVTFLIRSATKQWRGLRNIPSEVTETMQESLGTIERLTKTHPDIPLLSPLPEDLQDFPDMPYVTDADDIYGWIRQITAGLVYDALRGFDPSIKWDEVGVMFPSFVETNNPPFAIPEELIAELERGKSEVDRLSSVFWFDGWASGKRNPYPNSIYRFQISFLPDNVYFRHRFYDAFDAYVRFSPLPKTILKLKQKVGASV